MMPSTRGPELAVGLQAVRPGLRVLYYSGYLGDVVRKRGVPAGEVLPKPFTRGALASAVRLLEAPAPETPPDLA